MRTHAARAVLIGCQFPVPTCFPSIWLEQSVCGVRLFVVNHLIMAAIRHWEKQQVQQVRYEENWS